MSNFSYLKKLSVKGKTAEFPISLIRFEKINGDEIENVTPVLIVSPATSINKPYINAVLRKMSKTLKRAANTGVIGKDENDELRKISIELYPRYVINSWEDMPNSEGNLEEFTEESCRDFLEAYPKELMDELIVFCSKNSSFAEVLDMESAGEIAKN